MLLRKSCLLASMVLALTTSAFAQSSDDDEWVSVDSRGQHPAAIPTPLTMDRTTANLQMTKITQALTPDTRRRRHRVPKLASSAVKGSRSPCSLEHVARRFQHFPWFKLRWLGGRLERRWRSYHQDFDVHKELQPCTGTHIQLPPVQLRKRNE